MFGLSDAHQFRKMLAGSCMLLAPLVLLFALVTQPAWETAAGAQLAAIDGNRDQLFISDMGALVFVVLAVPAVLGLMHMLREREVALGHLGGGLALLGLIATAGLIGISLVTWQMAAPVASGAEMAALLDRVNDTAGVYIPFFALTGAFGLGMALLALGLFRAKATDVAFAAALAVGAILLPVGLLAAVKWLAIVGAGLLIVSLVPIGWRILGETEEEWEHTPVLGPPRIAGTS